jgi:serine/threonine-protein kinase ULK4
MHVHSQILPDLMAIYSSTRNENVKATTASCLARLLRSSPALLAALVDKWGLRLFVQGLADPSSKVGAVHVCLLACLFACLLVLT